MILSAGIPRNDVRDLKNLGARVDDVLLRMVSAAQFITQKHIRFHSTGKSVGRLSARFGRTARGNLARSWQAEPATIVKGAVHGRLYSNHPGARILEGGDTIRPKKAGALAIPIHPLADRKTPADFTRASKGNPYGGTSLIKTARGVFIILNERRKTTFLFILKKSVTIPPHRYITNAVADATPEIDEVIRKGIQISIGGRP